MSIIVDLIPVITGSEPGQLLDMMLGHSAAAISDWIDACTPVIIDGGEAVSPGGFAGYRATAESPPAATIVMAPFRVVHLAAERVTVCLERVQQDTCGHSGRADDPLYVIRPVLLTRTTLSTAR